MHRFYFSRQQKEIHEMQAGHGNKRNVPKVLTSKGWEEFIEQTTSNAPRSRNDSLLVYESEDPVCDYSGKSCWEMNDPKGYVETMERWRKEDEARKTPPAHQKTFFIPGGILD